MNPILSKRIGVLLAAVLVTAAGCSNDSSSNNGSVNGTFVGTVTSSSGSALAGVSVTPSPANGPTVTTNSAGKYTLQVTPGAYTLKFSGDNLQSATSSSQDVAMGQTVTVDQVLQASPLTVTVSLPAAYKNGGATGFNTAVTGITATVKMNGTEVSGADVQWSVKQYDGVSAPPTDPQLTATSGSSTGITVGSFEAIRESANAWLNKKYATTDTPEEFEYIPLPERAQFVPFGVQQVRAMSYKVIARATSNGLTSTGNAVVSPVSISSGSNYYGVGTMVVANTQEADSYAWTMEFLAPDATTPEFGPAPAEVTLQAADSRNPYLVPTVAGVYHLMNGTDSLYFRASTYHGVGATPDALLADGTRCSTCHNDPDGAGPLDFRLDSKFDEWQNSAHGNHWWRDASATPMSLFQGGLDGYVEPGHYSGSCISCHTTGYNAAQSAANKGFDDIAAEQDPPWKFPTDANGLPAPAAGLFDALPQAMRERGTIGCESCHGPLEPTEHSQPHQESNPAMAALFALPISPVASMSAGICFQCHDALNNHDRAALWSASPHANLELAIEEGAGSTSCARCHSAEGFMLYLPLQQAGSPGNLPDISTLNVATVNPQSCQTCHDPHSTELRVENDTMTVAGMFRVQNAGAGALCMVCHNSRSGAVKQGTFTFASNNLGRLGPHTAAQGDMFAGRNAFFMPNLTATDAATNLPYLSAHAFMSETCVDCHVKWIPPEVKTKYNPAGTNHTFRASLQVCAECHGEDIGERIQESVSEKMATLQDAVSAVLSAKLMQAAGFDTAAGGRKDPENTSVTLPDPADLTVLPANVRSIVARQDASAVVVTLIDGTGFYIGLDKINGANVTTSIFNLSEANTQDLLRAYFNLLFVNNDGAKGIHNPAFAAAILDNATAKLKGPPAVVIP